MTTDTGPSALRGVPVYCPAYLLHLPMASMNQPEWLTTLQCGWCTCHAEALAHILAQCALPLHLRSSGSLATFESSLKSHLFSSAYHV